MRDEYTNVLKNKLFEFCIKTDRSIEMSRVIAIDDADWP